MFLINYFVNYISVLKQYLFLKNLNLTCLFYGQID